MRKRRAARALGALLAAVMLASPVASAQTLQFGTTGRADSTSIPVFIAVEKKLFDAEGLTVNWIAAGSAARAVQQTVAGSLDLSIAATDAMTRAVKEGAAIKIVAGTVGAAPFRVLGAKTVKTWSDLKGKTISVGGPSDQTLYFFRVMARKNGLDDKAYDLLYAGTTPARFTQLVSGAIGAAVLTNPNDIMAMKDGYNDLGAAADYVPVWSQNNAFVNADWARDHRMEVLAFLRAYRKATAIFYDPAQHDAVVSILARYSNTDPDTAERVYRFYIDKKILAQNAALSEPGIQAVVDSLVTLGELKESFPAASMIDGSYLRELDR